MIKEPKTNRLHFIDAMRAWAILMMLQGHFVSALLSEQYQDQGNLFYSIWSYFRGVTAPVFFTVSGFIFTFLLIRKYDQGFSNPRVKKGITRGFQLIAIGYILQIRFARVIKGTINDTYDIVHVLQCLGLSIIVVVLLYLLSFRFKKQVFATHLCTVTVLLFVFKTTYEQWDYSFMPEFFSNYFTKMNGSVFTIMPWFGFTSFGGFMAVVFATNQAKNLFYRKAILTTMLLGSVLITTSYEISNGLYELSGSQLLEDAVQSSYLFARLGAVLCVFSFFMFFRNYLKSMVLLRVGQLTLAIYIVHAIVLYNSITGYGLSRFYYHSLPPMPVILGAISFVVLISVVVLLIDKKMKELNFNQQIRNLHGKK
ncbi:DUF1624 domain-containing protein [Maribacter sp.]|nr:DUF1624 domain-containing protein [Maribacter sp.]